MSEKLKSMTVGELLGLYPDGFTISASGTLEKIVGASSHLNIIARVFPLPPQNGGYLVVDGVSFEEVENAKT